jgi:hypothetical protein
MQLQYCIVGRQYARIDGPSSFKIDIENHPYSVKTYCQVSSTDSMNYFFDIDISLDQHAEQVRENNQKWYM